MGVVQGHFYLLGGHEYGRSARINFSTGKNLCTIILVAEVPDCKVRFQSVIVPRFPFPHSQVLVVYDFTLAPDRKCTTTHSAGDTVSCPECGCSINSMGLPRHRKSQKCKDNLHKGKGRMLEEMDALEAGYIEAGAYISTLAQNIGVLNAITCILQILPYTNHAPLLFYPDNHSSMHSLCSQRTTLLEAPLTFHYRMRLQGLRNTWTMAMTQTFMRYHGFRMILR